MEWQCSVCRKIKSRAGFSRQSGICKECRAARAKAKYAERKEKGLCPICGKFPSMVSSCMCESCWFIRNKGPRVKWIEQGRKCPYTGTSLVPGHNMRFVDGQWISKRYAVASRGMKPEQFKEWCRIVAKSIRG